MLHQRPPPIAEDFPKLITEMGFGITVAEGMESALAYIHEHHEQVDVVMTHIDLQDGSSGLELLEAIKDMSDLQEKPVIVFAANANFKGETDEATATNLAKLIEDVAEKGAILVPVKDVYLTFDQFQEIGAEVKAIAENDPERTAKLGEIATKRLGLARQPFAKVGGMISDALASFRPNGAESGPSGHPEVGGQG